MNFCAIFTEDMDSLYSLALLLTADGELAEECFLAALEDCRSTKTVFSERVRSWSRRAIIKRAIQRMRPAPSHASAESAAQPDRLGEIPLRLLHLRTFERFIFAMVVLERYSAWECATLLDCRVQDVERARIAALTSLGEQGGSGVTTPDRFRLAPQLRHIGVPA